MAMSISMIAYSSSCALILAICMTSRVGTSMASGNIDSEIFSTMSTEYPIVLVHGFLGWGPDEMLGYRYFGGNYPIKPYLENLGFTVFEPSVGPLSSTWDRSIELYTQLKGGKVDYGAHHSGGDHNRYGEIFEALYPEWGTFDPKSKLVKKVNFIAHSAGGQDVRLLTSLLYFGDDGEKEKSGDGVSDLFIGGRSWVGTVVTLVSPHDGTSLATSVSTFLPFVRSFIVALVLLSGAQGNNDTFIYDLKLSHFGLQRHENESLDNYLDRAFDSRLWESDYLDVSLHSLSPEGARDLNKIAIDVPDVYYFSYSSKTTYSFLLSSFQLPTFSTEFVLQPICYFLGSFSRAASGTLIEITSDWYTNDGVVNTISQHGPTLGVPKNHRPVHYDNESIPLLGTWNSMPLKDWDHLDIVGLGSLSNEEVESFYVEIGNSIKNLPLVRSAFMRDEPPVPPVPTVLTVPTETLDPSKLWDPPLSSASGDAIKVEEDSFACASSPNVSSLLVALIFMTLIFC